MWALSGGWTGPLDADSGDRRSGSGSDTGCSLGVTNALAKRVQARLSPVPQGGRARHGGHMCLLTRSSARGPQVGDAQVGRPAADSCQRQTSSGTCLGSGWRRSFRLPRGLLTVAVSLPADAAVNSLVPMWHGSKASGRSAQLPDTHPIPDAQPWEVDSNQESTAPEGVWSSPVHGDLL